MYIYRKIFYVLLMLCICRPCYCQDTLKRRYKDFIFSKVTIEKNITYQAFLNAGIKKKYGLLDLYLPAGDSSSKRPLIIWIHGGGFKFGNKKSRGMPIWSKNFAQRGYVCAAINYRLSKKNPLSNFTALVGGCRDAIEDVAQAILFFKNHFREYRVDTGNIILAGNSAGGIVALQAAYSSARELAMLSKDTSSAIASPEYNSLHIAAVINYWGALFSTDWLRNAQVPIVSVQGSKDRVVPYDHKKSAALYGSFAIHKKADSLSIPNNLKTYQGYGHELQKHFNPLWAGRASKKRFRESGQFAADFLYEILFAKALSTGMQ